MLKTFVRRVVVYPSTLVNETIFNWNINWKTNQSKVSLKSIANTCAIGTFGLHFILSFIYGLYTWEEVDGKIEKSLNVKGISKNITTITVLTSTNTLKSLLYGNFWIFTLPNLAIRMSASIRMNDVGWINYWFNSFHHRQYRCKTTWKHMTFAGSEGCYVHSFPVLKCKPPKYSDFTKACKYCFFGKKEEMI